TARSVRGRTPRTPRRGPLQAASSFPILLIPVALVPGEGRILLWWRWRDGGRRCRCGAAPTAAAPTAAAPTKAGTAERGQGEHIHPNGLLLPPKNGVTWGLPLCLFGHRRIS